MIKYGRWRGTINMEKQVFPPEFYTHMRAIIRLYRTKLKSEKNHLYNKLILIRCRIAAQEKYTTVHNAFG